ncbi:SLAP domain-containing protein [Aquisalibacillus elongatus]|uniref:SLAP domain-containing protein n=1 Tax=Aquisalibacillus elongatus TaxID=485577 RepID=A0A3N5B8Q5_9BACI|nr:SLAP domain-containing protein [Aquisalibacillus elongatus]RPF53369.1 SLAP domain-containing protein [Aquisalibacillus elongatus]
MKKIIMLFSLLFILGACNTDGEVKSSQEEPESDPNQELVEDDEQEKSNEEDNNSEDEQSNESNEEDTANENQGSKDDEDVEENNDEEGKGVASVPVKQLFDFGPDVDGSQLSEEVKNEMQLKVNELGDPMEDTIQFNGFNAFYRDDGTLTVEAFIRNGYHHPIWDITATLKVKDKSGEEILANGEFILPKDEFGTLEPTVSRVWALNFMPEQVMNSNADLSEYIIEADYEYNY